AAEFAEPAAEVDEVVVDGAAVDVDQAPAERRPVRGERPHAELADEDLRAVAHALAQAETEDQEQAAEFAEPAAEVDEVVVDGAAVDVDQAPAERRPTWRERLHGELTDEELQTAHVSALTQAQQAAAAAAQAVGSAAEKQSRAEAGTGPAAEAVQAQAEALQQRAEAVQALAELTPEFDATGAQAIELRARLAEAEAGAGSRWRGPRERAAVEAAALRSQLEQVTRRLVELDIQRERLDRLAGPAPARAGAVQQWETTAQALPQMLAQARSSDLQDAALAQANVRALQQRAAEAQASAETLAAERQIRAEQRPADSLTEGLQRTAARISAAAGDARREHEQDAAYGYEYTDQEWDRSADDGGRSR
ncbi:hypothetical protein ACIG5E_34435, partial [Kitasatospora sp. NPDC053057]|uniref:hypothetical protein n=1 Tax=Kitasatospora sp. NPDC053057 TaxID=3364062 RepID=UPI0037C5960E